MAKWIDVENSNGEYKVSDDGCVKTFKNGRWGKKKEGKILKQNINIHGYPYVVLNGKTKSIHRLVAEHFIPNPKNKKCVNHIDCDKTNNNTNNLEWCTYKENSIHAYENGLITIPKNQVKGGSHYRTNFSKNDILDIRNAYKLGCFTQSEIAESYGVGQDHISRIVNKKVWKHV